MGRPLLVLAHGTRATRHIWDGYDELLPDADVLAIDLPGHGDLLDVECTRDAVMGAFDDAVAQAAQDQPVVLVGHSLGGYLSALWARDAAASGRAVPDALVLVGTTGDPASAMALVYKAFMPILRKVGPERMTVVANAMYRLLGERGDLPGPEAYRALEQAWRIVFAECGPDNLRELRCPVVPVNGQFDQMRIHAKQFEAAAVHAERHLVPGATHLLPVTHALALAEILTAVVRDLDARGPVR